MLEKLTIDFPRVTAEEIIGCMRNAGYIIAQNDRDFQLMCDGYFKYDGFRGGMHIYNAAFKSEVEGFFMCDILVSIGKGGKLVAEYSAKGPYMQDMDEDHMDLIFNVKS